MGGANVIIKGDASIALADLAAESARCNTRLMMLMQKELEPAEEQDEQKTVRKFQRDTEKMMQTCRRFLLDTQRWGED